LDNDEEFNFDLDNKKLYNMSKDQIGVEKDLQKPPPTYVNPNFQQQPV